MSIDKKLLTAYAMGEAKGADEERAKAMVERDPEARKFVDQLRAFSSSAAADLAREPLPGARGAAPIRAEIERRAKLKTTVEPARGWWREWALVSMVGIAVVGFQYRSMLPGLDRLRGEHHEPVDYQTESFFGRGGIQVEKRDFKMLAPEKYEEVFQTLAALDSRSMEEVILGSCHLRLPEVIEGDTSTGEGAQLFREYQGQGGVLIQVMAAGFSLQGFAAPHGEEAGGGSGFKILKQATDDGSATFYRIPHSAETPVCALKAYLPQIDFSHADTGEIRAAVNNFAKKLIDMAEAK